MWQHPALVQEGQVLGLTFRVEGSEGHTGPALPLLVWVPEESRGAGGRKSVGKSAELQMTQSSLSLHLVCKAGQ